MAADEIDYRDPIKRSQAKQRIQAAEDAEKPVKMMSAAILQMGHSSTQALESLKKTNDAMSKMTKFGALRNKIMFENQWKMNQAMIKGSASVATASMRLFDTINFRDAKGKIIGQMKPITGLLAQAFGPSEKVIGRMSSLFPTFAKSLMMAPGPLIALSAILMVLKNSFTKSWQGAKDLTKALGFQRLATGDAVKWGAAAALASAQYGVKQEEMAGVLGDLGDTMALTSRATGKMGKNWATVVGDSIGEFLGMAKYAGLSAAESGKLASNLTMLGFSVKKLPTAFAEFQGWVKDFELTPNLMMETLGDIAPVSITSATAIKTFTGTFASFKRTFDESTRPVMAFLRDAPAGSKLMADAMQSFGKASASLNLPELLAFGGGGKAGTSLIGAVENVLAQGNDRAQIMINYIKEVTRKTPGGENAQRGAVFALLERRFGIETSRAYVLEEMLTDLRKTEARAKAGDKGAGAEAERKRMRLTATMNAAIEDPLQKLVDLASTMVMRMFPALLNALMPGQGTAMAMSVSEAKGQMKAAASYDAQSPKKS